MSKTFNKIFDWVSLQKKRVYFFHEGAIEDKNLLGSKGANLCEMFRLGLPVPPGFVITTEACGEFFKQDRHKLLEHFIDEYSKSIKELEKQSGKQFGIPGEKSKGNVTDMPPLLLSIRSGAAIPIPGMMHTVLNLGINDDLVQVMARLSNNPRWAYDTYRRFLQMYGTVVLHADKKSYEDILEKNRSRLGIANNSQLTTSDLQHIVAEFKKVVEVPQDPWEQLQVAIESMFCSWYSPQAVKYRDINNIVSDLGTAVIIQSMVYGNMNARSGSGIVYSRSPISGEKEVYGSFMENADGEDVIHSNLANLNTSLKELQQEQPVVYDSLLHVQTLLEKHYRDMQEIEFTVENGVLFILESRNGKRTAKAAVSIAVSMVTEKLINEREALLRIDPQQMDYFLHPMIEPNFAGADNRLVQDVLLGKGSGVTGGLVVGHAVFNASEVEECTKKGESCILCKTDISMSDMNAIRSAIGVLTTQTALNSYSAELQRELGKSAVVDVKGLAIDAMKHQLTSDNNHLTVNKGDIISIDGKTGLVYRGEIPTIASGQDEYFYTILTWADKYKKLRVFANAESVTDVRKASELGATGIGMFKTESMFFQKDCIDLFRKVLLTDNESERCKFLSQLLPLHEEHLLEVFQAVENNPVTVRLLDCPLQDFFPSPQVSTYQEEVNNMAQRLSLKPEDCFSKIKTLQEVNPMLGKRGVRLSILHPEITIMQTKAIIGAALKAKQHGLAVKPHILIPMVCSDHEIDCITPVIYKTWVAVCEEAGHSVNYLDCTIGSMVEVPRACLRAEKIAVADYIDFLCIGSNKLTQLIFGVSWEDMQKYLPIYLEKHIIAKDPFADLDIPAVGSMMQLAVRKSRNANAAVKINVSGEHCGDPNSIRFFNKIGVDCISCSPYRVPVAKLAAAQAYIEETGKATEERQHMLQYPPGGMFSAMFPTPFHY